ncbi:membrane metallo-endopeptidase-like 1 isoform X2 [Actinia tenebrosa]|uniref:Membrane metallo-endopeptidase-like 1 isoform X2 n=1 Tax=Actinia tenebrosa TaxID=6105 RepID=A0A6P8IQD9_ACTTE|nr:membrane metallo-endopeptidase-like 1 isoform X2 [Actinia tenebrosa]
MGKLLRELNVETLLHFGVREDPLNPTKRVLELSEPNIGLHMYYYHEKNSSSVQHQAYKRLLKTVGRMFSRSNFSDDKMMAIYDFEKSIFKIFKENYETQSRKLTHFAGSKSRQRRTSDPQEPHMSLLLFSNVSGMPLPFLQKTLSIIFKRDFSGKEEIRFNPVTNTKLWRNLYILIQETNESVVVDYMMWQVIRKYLKAVPELYNLTISEFHQTANNKTTVDQLRSKQCILIMSSPFDSTLGFLYLELVIKNDPKKKIEKVFENIRSSFIARLEKDTWMDPRTKENAKQKLHITDNFFLNYKAISHFSAVKSLNTYGTPVDRSEWTPDKIYVMNAFYIADSNKIVVPAGIIQPPFYSPDFPMYLVYGGIGMVIGHEITHGFDGLGRKYGSNGKKEDWWSKSSSQSFKQKAKCLEEQYNKYPVFGKNINGSLTLDENIADNGGIRLAYEAYQRWKKENGSEKILPGLTLSPDQLFFVGFAQLWCSSFNEASADYSTKYDPLHAFPKYRVIGPLTNFNKFSEAFNCPANSPMNPSTKCGIW